MNKIVKIILWIICLILVLFVLASAALPSWISTPSGTKTALKWINNRIEGTLSVEKINSCWLGSQHLENVKYEDKNGTKIFSVVSLDTKTPLLFLFFGSRSLAKTEIDRPYLYYQEKTKEEKEGEESKNRGRKTGKPLTFKDGLLVTHGTVIFAPKNTLPITLSDIYINKQASPDHLKIEAFTDQGEVKGALSIDASLEPKLQAKINIKDFPIAILDQLGETNLFTDGLGPRLNGDLNIERENRESLSITGSLKSANLIATVDGKTEKKNFVINPATHLEFTITPAFFKQLIEEKKRGDWELASKTVLNVQIEKGIFPLNLKKPDFREITLQAKAKINRAELHHAKVGSYSLNQFDLSVSSLNNLELTFIGNIQGKEATDLKGHISIPSRGSAFFDFTCQGFPTTLLELFSLQIEKNVRFLFGSRFDMEGKGTYAKGAIESDVVITSSSTALNGHITGNLDEINFEASGTHQIHGAKAKILGSFFNFTLKGISNYEDRHFSLPFIKGNLFNPHFDLSLSGQGGEKGKPFTYDHLQLLATGAIKKLPIEEDFPQSNLQNTTLFFQLDGSKNQIIGKAESQALDAHFEMNQFIHDDEIVLDKADMHFSCNLNDFPVAVISPFVAEDFDLTSLIGKTLSLTSKGSYTPGQEPLYSLDLNAKGSGFSTSLAIALDDTLLIKQNRPSYVYWELTPARYDSLMRLFRLNPQYEPTFTLTRPTQIELNITQFICPSKPSKNLGHFLCQSGFVGDIRMGSTTFRSKKTNESIIFQAITGAIKGENFSEALNLALSGEIFAENIPEDNKSAFSFEGEMFNFWTKEGRFNREELTVKGMLKLDLLPVRQITGMFPIDPETRSIIQAVLGELVNTRIYGEISQMAGPLTIDIKSSNFKAKLPLTLHRNAIYLRDYVDAEITLTQAVNEIFLADINPLLIAGAFSDHPLKVNIDPKGFVLPIRPYSLAGVQIGQAVIDIGKIRVRNGGQIEALLKFLNVKEGSPDGLMQAWFTPIFMSLHNGVATYKRFDALIGSNIHFALWGSINLLNGGVNMTLGIAPRTLQERFKIGGLSKSELFQVKMTGTTKKLELDWSSAQTRIAFIVARTAAGGLGTILGGILESIVPKLGEEPSPPPTTDPLPWESLYSSELSYIFYE